MARPTTLSTLRLSDHAMIQFAFSPKVSFLPVNRPINPFTSKTFHFKEALQDLSNNFDWNSLLVPQQLNQLNQVIVSCAQDTIQF